MILYWVPEVRRVFHWHHGCSRHGCVLAGCRTCDSRSFSHGTASYRSINQIFSIKVHWGWWLFCSLSSTSHSCHHVAVCHPFFPCQHRCSDENFEECIQLRNNTAKTDDCFLIVCFPDSIFLPYSATALQYYTLMWQEWHLGKSRRQGLGGHCLSWYCCKGKCIKKPQPEVQDL